MVPNHGGDPVEYILWPIGSHWGQEMGQNRKKISMPEKSNFWLLGGHRFGQKFEFTVMAQIHSGDTLGSILGPMGSHWAKKWVKTVKSIMPQNSSFWLLRGHRLGQKIEFTVMAPNHGGDPLGSILGPMGSHWGLKMGQNRKKITMPQNSNFWQLPGHRFGQKFEFTVMAPNHDGEPLGSILGPMGSHLAKKWVKTVKKLPCPKIRIFDYSAVIDLGKK